MEKEIYTAQMAFHDCEQVHAYEDSFEYVIETIKTSAKAGCFASIIKTKHKEYIEKLTKRGFSIKETGDMIYKISWVQ